MEELILVLKRLGITAKILVIILGIWLIFSVYKNYLETQKIKLEIANLLKLINNNNPNTNNPT